MRRRTNVVATAVLTAAMSFPLTGVASAQDRDCGGFSTQAAAQAVYDQDRSDPNRLDRDKDGIACETWAGGIVGGAEGSSPVAGTRDTGTVPRGGVETGAGGTAEGGSPDDGPGLTVLAVTGGVALVVGGVVLSRRRSVRRSG